GAAVLRGAGADSLRAEPLGPPPLSPRGPAAGRLHRLRAAHRAVARRDPRRAGAAAEEPRAGARRLGETVSAVEGPDRRTDRRARAAAGDAQRVHRLRLPVAGSLRARQPRGSRGAPRSWPALLDR